MIDKVSLRFAVNGKVTIDGAEYTVKDNYAIGFDRPTLYWCCWLTSDVLVAVSKKLILLT